MATERYSLSNGSGIHRPEDSFTSRKKSIFKKPNFLVPAIATVLTAGDLLSTQAFFNTVHATAMQAESSIIGQMLMNGGNNVFTSQVLEFAAGRVAYTALPFLVLNTIGNLHKDNKDSWNYYGPKTVGYTWVTASLLGTAWASMVNNPWQILNAKGVLPEAPWQEPMRYWLGDLHLFDPVFDLALKAMDFSDKIGGLGNLGLLGLGVTGLATAGAVWARKSYLKKHRAEVEEDRKYEQQLSQRVKQRYGRNSI